MVLSHTPKNKAELTEMNPGQFEDFAIDVLRRAYARYNVVLIGTQHSKDGGKDAVAVSEFFPDLPDDLQVRVLLWVEAKQRRSSVGIYSAGRHLVAAFCKRVNKIVFVTDSDFTRGLRQEIEDFCDRANLQYGLISGEDLLCLFRRFGEITQDPDRRKTKSIKRPAISRHAYTLRVVGHFSEGINDKTSRQQLYVLHNEPFFLTIDISVENADDPCMENIQLKHACGESLQVFPYASMKRAILSLGDNLRLRYVVWSSISTFINLAHFRILYSGGETVLEGEDTVSVSAPLFNKLHFDSQERVLASLESCMRKWIERPCFIPLALTAPAGYGKTYALGDLRRVWLSAGCREIILDGEAVRNESSFISKMFNHLFPLPPEHFDEAQIPILTDWLIEAGLSQQRAATVAHSIATSNSVNEASTRLLSEVVVGLVSNATVECPLVIFIEDLHKVRHSVLEILCEAIRLLVTINRSRCLLFMSSRDDSEVSNQELRQAWRNSLRELLTVTMTFQLPAPEEDEARKSLSSVIAGLDGNDADRIISQVGRTPFALKEAILFLHGVGIVQNDPRLGGLFLRLPEDLKARIESDQLKHATALRLRLLRERYNPWLGRLLNMAACYGKQFPLDVTLSVAQVEMSLEISAGLATCRQECVISSAHEGLLFTFDHDLVRVIALMEMSEADRILAASLWLKFLPIGSDTRLLATLSFIAARGDDFICLAETYSKERLERHQYADAAESLTLALAVSDPQTCGSSIRREAAMAFDDSLADLPLPRLTHRLPSRILDLSLRTLDCQARVSAGTSTLEERIIGAAELLARKLNDITARAILLRRRGKMSLERGDPDNALIAHQSAEMLFANFERSQTGSLTSERFDNNLELAITLRHVGQKQESRKILEGLLNSIRSGSASERTRCLANLGALEFYTNPTGCRRAWTEAQNIAAQASLSEFEVHMLLDLADLDIAERAWDDASRRASNAFTMADEMGLDNELLRANVMKGILSMVDADWQLAVEFFKDAEHLGLKRFIGRRLWKCRSNAATVAELLNNPQSALLYDQRAVASLPLPTCIVNNALPLEQWPDARIALALANITLRAEEFPMHREFLALQVEPLRVAGNRLAIALRQKNKEDIGGELRSLLRYGHVFAGKLRFIVT